MLDNSGYKFPEALLMALCFKIVPADIYRIVSHDHSLVAQVLAHGSSIYAAADEGQFRHAENLW